jgi:hypothetical protein
MAVNTMKLIACLVLLAVTCHAQQGGWGRDRSSITTPQVNAGEMNYSDTYWDDSMVPALAITGGATAPGLVAFNGSAVTKIYAFDGSGTPDDAQIGVQFSHRIKPGAVIHPHVHWCQVEAPSNAAYTNVVWKLSYSLAPVNGAFGTEAVVTGTNGISTTNWFHQVTGLTPITNSLVGISTILIGNITRASDEAADIYDKEAGFL